MKTQEMKPTTASFGFTCPGCHSYHIFEQGKYQFNGDLEKPTFEPDMHNQYSYAEQPKLQVCHFNLTDGMLIFHGDSTHESRGKTVPLP